MSGGRNKAKGRPGDSRGSPPRRSSSPNPRWRREARRLERQLDAAAIRRLRGEAADGGEK